MTTPCLSQPILYTPSELRSNPKLTTSIIRLANEAFFRSKAGDPLKWNNTTFRFPNEDAFHAMLGEDSIVALIFDRDQTTTYEQPDSEKTESSGSMVPNVENEIVACAAAVPWQGGWRKEGAGVESGWEIKAVCVHGDEKYLRRGLALQLLATLENHLSRRTQLHRDNGAQEDESHLTLWILAAECINGTYWRRRGYQEVRRRTEGVGVWSCKTSFEMVVFRKKVLLAFNAQLLSESGKKPGTYQNSSLETTQPLSLDLMESIKRHAIEKDV